jgi:hypothetical protein
MSSLVIKELFIYNTMYKEGISYKFNIVLRYFRKTNLNTKKSRAGGIPQIYFQSQYKRMYARGTYISVLQIIS